MRLLFVCYFFLCDLFCCCCFFCGYGWANTKQLALVNIYCVTCLSRDTFLSSRLCDVRLFVNALNPKHTHIISSSQTSFFDTLFFECFFFALVRYSSLSPYYLMSSIRDSFFCSFDFECVVVVVAVFANAYNATTTNTGISNECVCVCVFLSFVCTDYVVNCRYIAHSNGIKCEMYWACLHSSNGSQWCGMVAKNRDVTCLLTHRLFLCVVRRRRRRRQNFQCKWQHMHIPIQTQTWRNCIYKIRWGKRNST